MGFVGGGSGDGSGNGSGSGGGSGSGVGSGGFGKGVIRRVYVPAEGFAICSAVRKSA